MYEPTRSHRLSGREPFTLNGTRLGQTVDDFWAWALSDLRDNTTRGLLAEYIVASASGAVLGVRDSWANVDLETPDGFSVEVKACARLQSWKQPKLSKVSFTGLRGRVVNDHGVYGSTPEYRAQAYVFCLHRTELHADYQALDFGQWAFWVLRREDLAKLGQNSIGLATLERLAGPPVEYQALEGRFDNVVRKVRG